MNTLTQFYEQIKQEVKQELTKEFEEKLNNTFVEIKNLQNELNEVKQQLKYTVEKRNEIFYQKHLEKLLNGTHKNTKHGITDIFTKDAIYEIKGWKNYKSCFGQLKSYYVGNEDKRLCAAFYGEINEEQKQKITELFSQNKIEVYEITESYDGVISLKHLNEHLNEFVKENDEESDFYKWLNENIVYKESGVLNLTETVSLYLGKEILHSKELSKYKKDIEKYIKEKYPDLRNEYGIITIKDKQFRGWKNLSITNSNNEFYKWLDENIVYHENSILNLKDICEMYFQKEAHNRDKNRIKILLERWLKVKFPLLDNICKYSRYNGIKYNGWVHLSLK